MFALSPRRVLLHTCAAALLSAAAVAPALAQQDNTVTGDRGGDMVADLVIVRPVGLVASVLGTAGFVISLPFTLLSGSVGDSAHELVGKPFEYTFARPLGDFDHCGRDRKPCGQR
jgi:hypothetical protein